MFYLNLFIFRTSLVFIPFVLGCFVYRKLDTGTRVLIFFLGYVIFSEIFGFVMFSQGFKSDWILHLYTLCEFCFVTVILASWQSEPKSRKAFLLALPPFFLIWLIAKVTFERFHQFDSYTAALAAVILVFMSAFTLIDLLSANNFTTNSFCCDPRFRIICTFLIFFAGGSVGLATRDETLLQWQRGIFIFPIFTVLDIIQYTGFTGGLLCFLPRPIFGGHLSLER